MEDQESGKPSGKRARDWWDMFKIVFPALTTVAAGAWGCLIHDAQERNIAIQTDLQKE